MKPSYGDVVDAICEIQRWCTTTPKGSVCKICKQRLGSHDEACPFRIVTDYLMKMNGAVTALQAILS